MALSSWLCPELKTTHRLHPTVSPRDFHLWKTKLNFVLLDNNLDYVLTKPKPLEEPDSKFLRDDAIARHIILSTIDDDLVLSYDHYDTAKSLMDALTLFFSKSSSRYFAFKRFYDHSYVLRTDIRQHIVTVRALAKELELEGVEVDEQTQVNRLIDSLPVQLHSTMDLAIRNMEKNGTLSLENVCRRMRCIEKLNEKNIISVQGCSGSGQYKGPCLACDDLGRWTSDSLHPVGVRGRKRRKLPLRFPHTCQRLE